MGRSQTAGKAEADGVCVVMRSTGGTGGHEVATKGHTSAACPSLWELERLWSSITDLFQTEGCRHYSFYGSTISTSCGVTEWGCNILNLS